MLTSDCRSQQPQVPQRCQQVGLRRERRTLEFVYKIYEDTLLNATNSCTTMICPLASCFLRRHALFATLAVLLASGPCSAIAQSPQVNVGGTTITGVSQAYQAGIDIDFFGGMTYRGDSLIVHALRYHLLCSGIPYAQPPVGKLRFAPPVLLDEPATDALDATHFGPPCVQLNVPFAFLHYQDEETLTFRPSR